MWIFNKKEKLYKAFKDYIPHEKLVKIIRNDPKSLIEIQKGTEKFMSIAQTNMNNYVGIAEQIELSDLKKYMEKYYVLLHNIILKHEGTIEKFEADDISYMFGFYETENVCRNSCLAALDQINVIKEEFNPWAVENNLPKIKIRISIASGNVIIGNMGSEGVINYSALGDVVNIALKLKEQAKEFEPAILVDENTYSAVEQFSFSENMVLERGLIKINYYQLIN